MLLREFSQHNPSTISLPHQTFPPKLLKRQVSTWLFDFFISFFLFNPLYLVKPCDGSEILCSLQANNLACYSFLDASRRPESSGSEDCITYDTVSGTSFMFTAFPLSPGFHLGAIWSGPGDDTYALGLCHS